VSLLVLGACPVLAQQRPKTKSQPLPALETVSQANQKIRLLASTSTSVAQATPNALEPGDLISIDVFDIPELSRKIRIDPSGYISMPLIPQRIHAAGLTSFQLEKEVAGLLKARGLVSHPQVSVFVIDREGQPITIIGAVEHPMVYHAVGPTTLLEVLSAAGGLTSTAGNFVTISRTSASGKNISRRINLQALIDRGDPRANILLQGGDVVAVPKAGIVYVVGAVNRPGGFVIQNDTNQMTALKALALAGGIKGQAKPQDAVIIRKDGQTGHTQEITINIKKILDRKKSDVSLQANDVLFVPNSPGKKFLAKAAQAALSITTGIVILRGSSGTF
jgi:polysaccharide export outer membrane protein